MPGDDWQQLANLRLLLAWQWTHPGAKLLFMGTEFANPDEWDHQKALPWERSQRPEVQGLLHLITDLNRLYRTEPALHRRDTDPCGIRFICSRDDLRSIYVYERHHDARRLVIILNATPVPRERYVVGLPSGGTWTELLNTDSAHYAGTDVGNLGAVVAHPDPTMGKPYSATVRLPPLGAVILAATDDSPAHS
jgi:1,4-alpha-glucan branching enzyme